jgi:hypothetical protein
VRFSQDIEDAEHHGGMAWHQEMVGDCGQSTANGQVPSGPSPYSRHRPTPKQAQAAHSRIFRTEFGFKIALGKVLWTPHSHRCCFGISYTSGTRGAWQRLREIAKEPTKEEFREPSMSLAAYPRRAWSRRNSMVILPP